VGSYTLGLVPYRPPLVPRLGAAAAGAPTMGTGTLKIGSGSSVKEGVVTGRDVLGSPDGAPLVSIDTAVGEGNLRGSGGDGDSVLAGGSPPQGQKACMAQAEVQQYLSDAQHRTISGRVIPPGVPSGEQGSPR